MKKEKHLINKEITSQEVRITGDIGKGKIYQLNDALRLSSDNDMDLILINNKTTPNICIIEDYSKFLYNLKKKEKENKSKQVIIETKEIRFSSNIDDNDLNTKLNHSIDFLNKGNKVKFTVIFKGREMQYKQRGFDLLNDIAKSLEDIIKVETPPKLEGRRLSMIVSNNINNNNKNN